MGTSSHDQAREVTPLHDLSLQRPVIIVLGNEGFGVRKNILNRCETLVTITSKTSLKQVSVTTSDEGNDNAASSGVDDGDNGVNGGKSQSSIAPTNVVSSLDYVDSLNVSVCGGIILHHIFLNSGR